MSFPYFSSELFERKLKEILSTLSENSNGVTTLERISYSQVILIPNIASSSKMGDSRYIVLLNSTFKIFYKILANKLSSHL